MSNSESAPIFQAPCRHLRSKEMYYQPLGQEDDQFSSGLFWCNRTHESIGPDGENVSKGQCCVGRSCFGS
jgi:hypothetical protein